MNIVRYRLNVILILQLVGYGARSVGDAYVDSVGVKMFNAIDANETDRCMFRSTIYTSLLRLNEELELFILAFMRQEQVDEGQIDLGSINYIFYNEDDSETKVWYGDTKALVERFGDIYDWVDSHALTRLIEQ